MVADKFVKEEQAFSICEALKTCPDKWICGFCWSPVNKDGSAIKPGDVPEPKLENELSERVVGHCCAGELDHIAEV
jgi:hypothetical protein